MAPGFSWETSRQPVILAVDDDDDSLVVLIQTIATFDSIVLSATTGQKALELAQQHQPDLILLDIILPDLLGTVVVERLKQNPLTQNIPVIAVTALMGVENQARIFRSGCAGYLSKPYILEDLEALIQRYLRRVE